MKFQYKSIRLLSLLAIIFIASKSYAQMNPLVVGPIAANDSIVIVYDVTIDNPIPIGVTQLTNQGTISGGNFTSVVTDDPKTGAALDPTITLLNQWPLPIFFGAIRGYQYNSGINVQWDILTETDTKEYEVEKADANFRFSKVGTVPATGNNGSSITYTWFDAFPNQGNNYYRIKGISLDGNVKYSAIVNVKLTGTKNTIVIAPNPVQGKVLTLQFQGVVRDNYAVKLVNSLGQQVMFTTIKHSGGYATETINLGRLAAGTYWMEIKSEGLRFVKQVMIE